MDGLLFKVTIHFIYLPTYLSLRSWCIKVLNNLAHTCRVGIISFFSFFSIICQVVPKIFAYLVFSFGFIGSFKYPNAIIPSILALPLILSLARAIVYRISRRSKSWRFSLLFGLSTMYTLNEHDFSVTQPENTDEENRQVATSKSLTPSYSKLVHAAIFCLFLARCSPTKRQL